MYRGGKIQFAESMSVYVLKVYVMCITGVKFIYYFLNANTRELRAALVDKFITKRNFYSRIKSARILNGLNK